MDNNFYHIDHSKLVIFTSAADEHTNQIGYESLPRMMPLGNIAE